MASDSAATARRNHLFLLSRSDLASPMRRNTSFKYLPNTCPYYGCNYRRSRRKARIMLSSLSFRLHPPTSGRHPLRSPITSRSSRFSSSNLSHPKLGDRSVFGEHVNPFFSAHYVFILLYPLSFCSTSGHPFDPSTLPGPLIRFFPGRPITNEQVVSKVRRYRCTCTHTAIVTPSKQ